MARLESSQPTDLEIFKAVLSFADSFPQKSPYPRWMAVSEDAVHDGLIYRAQRNSLLWTLRNELAANLQRLDEIIELTRRQADGA